MEWLKNVDDGELYPIPDDSEQKAAERTPGYLTVTSESNENDMKPLQFRRAKETVIVKATSINLNEKIENNSTDVITSAEVLSTLLFLLLLAAAVISLIVLIGNFDKVQNILSGFPEPVLFLMLSAVVMGITGIIRFLKTQLK